MATDGQFQGLETEMTKEVLTPSYIEGVAKGMYSTLTPRPTYPGELSLEQVAVMLPQERERTKHDLKQIRANVLRFVVATYFVAISLLMAFAFGGNIGVDVPILTALFFIFIWVTLLHPKILVREWHLSGYQKIIEYEKLLVDFYNDLEELSRTLSEEHSIALLRLLPRKRLKADVLKYGTMLAAEIVTFERLGEEGEKKALQARKKLEQTYILWAKFELVSGGYTDFFRRAHEQHDKASVAAV